ncbi:hypothetical protein [Anaerotruncus colihominis]|uniref:hypothetical protein n=1 Tax=Anaerotruncus colihominis TaxID=169435 RepID=UPI002942C3C9|nr:hypothetical protein [Anaerotruncus colihominis]
MGFYICSRNKRNRLTAGRLYEGSIAYYGRTPYLYCTDDSGKQRIYPEAYFVEAGVSFAGKAQTHTQSKQQEEYSHV